MDKQVLVCAILDCRWWLDATPPDNIVKAPPAVVDEIFGAGVLTATWMHQHAREMHRELEDHYKTHTTLDWLRTTSDLDRRLNEALAALLELSNQTGQ